MYHLGTRKTAYKDTVLVYTDKFKYLHTEKFKFKGLSFLENLYYYIFIDTHY